MGYVTYCLVRFNNKTSEWFTVSQTVKDAPKYVKKALAKKYEDKKVLDVVAISKDEMFDFFSYALPFSNEL